ncbi:MAG: GNAT family N-acetyltransferase [Defluviitaleaceae bacterium]|nr:GNAT family N-acetyltransferase [Defluviitaleaceae bacterium]
MIKTEWILGINEADLAEVHAIRYAVFCDEQKIDLSLEIDGLDPSAIHLLVYYNGTPAATGRLLVLKDEFSIGRVAVLPQFRGQHLGDLVMRQLIRAAYDMGGEQQWIHAQVPVQGFYEKLGFKPHGNVYEEAGIPHIAMVHEGDVLWGNVRCAQRDK